MKKMSREEKYEYWRMVVDEFEKSGKSIRDQCRANDIPYAQYYDWRKKIKTKDSELNPSETFVEVGPSSVDDLPASGPRGISIEYCQDYHIRVSVDFNPRVLSSVLQVLRTSCSQ